MPSNYDDYDNPQEEKKKNGPDKTIVVAIIQGVVAILVAIIALFPVNSSGESYKPVIVQIVTILSGDSNQQLVPTLVVQPPTDDISITQTAIAGTATSIPLTQTKMSEPTSTPTTDLGATQTVISSTETAIALTLTKLAQPTATHTSTNTPSLTNTATNTVIPIQRPTNTSIPTNIPTVIPTVVFSPTIVNTVTQISVANSNQCNTNAMFSNSIASYG